MLLVKTGSLFESTVTPFLIPQEINIVHKVFIFFPPISKLLILKACERTPSFPGTLIRKHVAMNSKDLMGLPGLDEALHNVLLPLKFSLQEERFFFFSSCHFGAKIFPKWILIFNQSHYSREG